MQELEKIHEQIRNCRKCRLWKTRKHTVPGEGNPDAGIMFIGQAPGRREDETGRPFIGRAGQLLNKLLEKNGVGRKDVFITSVIKCFPPRNRIPKNDELESCSPYIEKQISLVNPEKIFLLGNIAIKTILGNPGRLEKIHGKKIVKSSVEYIPTYHPAAAMRFPEIKKKLEMDFKKHLYK